MPFVSVVVPTRDRPKHLGRTIESILAQRGVEFEVIVVDDGSQVPLGARDLSALRDPRVRILRNEQSRGACAARNRGVVASQAEYVAFSDDDCEWDSRKLEKQIRRLEETGADLVYCNTEIVDVTGHSRIVGVPDAVGADGWRAFLKRNFVAPFQVVVRRSVLLQVGGFDESLPRFQDWDLWLRLGRVATFAYVPEVLVRSEIVRGGISTQLEALEEASGALLAKHLPGLSAGDRASLLAAVGHELAIGGATEVAKVQFKEALRLRMRARVLLQMGILTLLGGATYRRLIRWRDVAQGTWVDRLVAAWWR